MRLSEFNRKINVPGVMVSLYNPYKGTALREYCDEEGLMQKDAHAGDYRSETVLNMPQISRQELLRLQKTFPLYVRFPKSEWPRIEKCEGNGLRKQKPCMKSCLVNIQRSICSSIYTHSNSIYITATKLWCSNRV